LRILRHGWGRFSVIENDFKKSPSIPFFKGAAV
jgi:hypothetical protein